MSILAASPTQSVWIPPALIEDPEAAAAEEGEGLTIEGILWGLIPGSSLVDGYQSWNRGDYASAILQGGLGGLDLLTLGTASKARGLLAFAGGVAKSRLKGLFIDAAAGEAGNVVGDRFGDEAGLLTELVVSGVLNGKLNTQDQKVLGFAADGGGAHLNRHSVKLVKRGGKLTEPNLPPKTIVQQGEVSIVHYTKSGDHGPPHLHVIGGGPETKIGQAGKPIQGSPELTPIQAAVVKSNKSSIRKAIDQIGRWFRFNEE